MYDTYRIFNCCLTVVSSNYLGFNIFDNAPCLQRFFPFLFFSKTILYAFSVCEMMLPPIFTVSEHQCFLLFICWFIFMLIFFMYMCMYMYVCMWGIRRMCRLLFIILFLLFYFTYLSNLFLF